MHSPLLLIVGMHRSGTSLLGSLLPACGIAMPGPLIPGDTHNPEGYFERADVTALQEQLLIDLERWWPAPRGMQPLPVSWLESPLGQTALAELVALLQPEAERQGGPWAIKDPRSSLLLPLWITACQQLGIPLKLLLAVRDPAEVMVSLVRRDQAATGMDGWRAQRLWWHHYAQVLHNGRDLPLQVISYSLWFKPRLAQEQLRRLAPHCSDQQRQQALEAIKPEHRRSRSHPLPAPITAPIRALHQRLERLAIEPSERKQLEQWLEQQKGLSALSPLPRRRSNIKRAFNTWRGHTPLNRVADHPWGYLVQLVCGSQGPVAEHLLNSWLTHGFRDFELERFSALPGPSPVAQPWCGTQPNVTIRVRGGDLGSWPTHALLQHCPIEGEGCITAVAYEAAEESELLLNLVDLDLQPCQLLGKRLLQWARLERVWDPNPERVRVLRQFGINASVLQTHQQTNNYLRPQQHSWSRCAALLGLPAPLQLKSLGTTLCLGNNGPQLDGRLREPLLGIPGFTGLQITTAEHAFLMASWLQGCLHAGLELVVFTPVASNEQQRSWSLFVQQKTPGLAPILLLDQHNPVEPNELLHELNWYRTGCPLPPVCSTPTPQAQAIFDQERSEPNALAVCISLFNYGARIQTALNSVLAQQQAPNLELIVVDDASSDNSAGVVQAWMTEHHQYFSRCILLQHTRNGGLASARNTAFSSARSPWCFVLDADNQLDPLALSRCGELAMSADTQCAVVHSLVRVSAEDRAQEGRHLVSDLPWQKEIFKHGNYIDAMALVRRDAWQAVGGYTHIPGGWEDFDFWCSLIDGGWHGILCPQVLATYTSHGNSMRATNTTRQERRLSRLLQTRHPWLQLPLAKNCGVWSNVSEEVSL